MKYTLKHNVTWNTILHVMYTLLYNEYGVQNYGLKNNKRFRWKYTTVEKEKGKDKTISVLEYYLSIQSYQMLVICMLDFFILCARV